jgi:hypothetical protein
MCHEPLPEAIVMAIDAPARRDSFLTALAIVMGLLAISNLWKPVAQGVFHDEHTGFILFGTRLHGVPNAIFAPLFGVALAAYAYGVWTLRRWVAPLAVAYATYVVVNLVCFMIVEPAEAQPPLAGMLAYAAVAIGVSAGGAYHLWRLRESLR